MKKLVFFLITLPLFLNAQTEKVKNWRFHFNYQFENIQADNNGNEAFYDFDFYKIEENQPATGHVIQIGFAHYLAKKIGFLYNLNYANRNFNLVTQYNSFVGFVENPIVLTSLMPFDPIVPVSYGPLISKTNHSNLEIETAFFWEQQLGKFGVSANVGAGLSYFLNLDTKFIDINPLGPSYGEEIAIEGDFKPDSLIPFGKAQLSLFYEPTDRTRFFLNPMFRTDFKKTQSTLLNNRFWAIGAALGVSIKI